MKLINDDCLKVLPTIPRNSIDIIITSPPYNINMNYNNYKDKRIDYIDWLSNIFNKCCKCLKDNGHFFINLSSSKDNPFTACKIAEKINWQLQNNIIWCKAIEIDGYVRG